MSAIQQLLTDHLNIWTAADTEKRSGRGRSSGNAASVYGIKKLRELILELAVRGKLVPQDPSDEPASELLKKNQVEKAKLIAEGKIKKEKPLPPISEDEKPFDLPIGWQFVRLGEILEMVNGRAFKPTDWTSNGLPIVRIQNLNNPSAPFNYCDSDSVDERHIINSGSFLISWSGTPGTSFGAFIWKGGKAALNQHIFSCFQIENPYFDDFLKLAINARLEELISKAHGGVGLQHVTKGKLEALALVLPPIAEQHRIVTKVDELMALCDQLETQHNNAAEAHEKLVSHLLATLTQSQNAAEFSENWQRIAAHFDTLFTTESSIDALKQTLLQLAVMGKLVPQDPNDEPASELLKKIQEQKAKLIVEGKIKKEKPQPLIGNEEKPFDSPLGWTFVRLGELLSKIGAGSTPLGGKQVYVKEGIPFLRSQNVWNDGLRLDDVAFITSETHVKMSGTHVYPGDLLFNITGASIGRCAIVPENFEFGNVSQHVTIVRPVSKVILDFLHRVLISNHVQQTVTDVQVGVSREGLSIGKLAQFVIPVPPLKEQHRIVGKVDELMSLCDQLKSRITAANQVQQKLADAMVEQTLSSECKVEKFEVPNRSKARAILGAEIIHQLHTEKTFGRVKLQKIVHLCEYVAGIEAVAGEYQRYAAGPHDPEMIADIESAIQQNEWYEEYQRDKFGHAYRPLSHAGEHRKKLEDYWQPKLPIIQKLIDAMRKWDTERCEIFSTLYAAWNDLLIFGKPVSDEAILSEVLERWNDSKTKISKKSWLEGLDWIRKEGFIPNGTGRPTRSEGLFD
jgi:type I restriction enzyme S subunit